MVLCDRPFMQLDATAMAAVLAPKLTATAIWPVLSRQTSDLLVLFSSANAFIGNPGREITPPHRPARMPWASRCALPACRWWW